MLTQADRNRIAVNSWTARTVPVVLAGVVGYATYVLVVQLCVKYLLVKHNDKSAAIPILVIYFMLFIPMTVCFLRLVHITVFHPPYIQLGPAALRDRQGYKKRGTARPEENGIAMGEYNPGNNSGGTLPEITGSNNDPGSPGLELFYTKDIFVCNTDGLPIWCSECCNWKPDRAHHDSSSGRCIQKMDHFCPWVGGPVGENNFKFFIQFNAYTALYCTHLLVVMAIYIQKQRTSEGEGVNRQFIAIIVLAGFFGLFTAGMTGTSLELAAKNLTLVERLGAKTKVYILAILKTSPDQLPQITPLGEITYPLAAGSQLNNHAPNHVPVTTANGNTPPPQTMDNAQNTQSSVTLAYSSLPQPPTDLPAAGTAQPSQQTSIPRLETAQNAVLAAADLAEQPMIATQENGKSVPGESRAAEDAVLSAGAVAQPSAMPIQASERPGETLSARDLRAYRTFAVLKMSQPGDNPWDLGSACLNIESLMGTSILDWVLPIRRSPCCNHESSEGQFQFGPKVDALRAAINQNEPIQYRLNGQAMSNMAPKVFTA